MASNEQSNGTMNAHNAGMTRSKTDSDETIEICRYFSQGIICKFGDKCRYRHVANKRKRSKSPLLKDPETPVCKDYLQNTCNRGKRCKFDHPPQTAKGPALNICPDYEKGKCDHFECRFFHISIDDKERFFCTGKISYSVMMQALKIINPGDIVIHGTPVCKFFQSGRCTLDNCKYVHMSPHEYENEVYITMQGLFHEHFGEPQIPNGGPEFIDLGHPRPYEDDYMFADLPPPPPLQEPDPYYDYYSSPRQAIPNDRSDSLRMDFMSLEREFQNLQKKRDEEITELKDQMARLVSQRSDGAGAGYMHGSQGQNNQNTLDYMHGMKHGNFNNPSGYDLSGNLQMKLKSAENEISSLKSSLFSANKQIKDLEAKSSDNHIALAMEENKVMVTHLIENQQRLEKEISARRILVPPILCEFLRSLHQSLYHMDNLHNLNQSGGSSIQMTSSFPRRNTHFNKS